MRAILTYHSIDDSGSPVSLDRTAFARHLEWFDRGEVAVVALGELVADPCGPAAVALTFDDAMVTAAEWALPALIERGLRATIFIPTGHVGRDTGWRGAGDAGVPVFPVMSWEALGRAQQAGMELGAHSRSHPRLPECSVTELHDEIAGAAEDIKAALGVVPASLAYPYGLVDATVKACAGAYYSRCVTTDLRPLGPAEDPYALPRLDAWYFRQSRTLDAWGSAMLRGYLGVRRVARRVRGWPGFGRVAPVLEGRGSFA